MIPTPWLLGGSALALVIVVGLWQVQVSRMEASHFRAISAEQQKARAVQGEFDAYKLQVEQTISNNARTHATELQAALDERDALASEVERLRALDARAKEERAIAESERVRELNNAKRDQDSLLDARTRAYYQRLRNEQLAAPAAASDQATRGSPN